ncbi:pantetheine-phosphate adenylyltransferase [Spiroplasma endosymbiont of Labia minor]|uniref:pantetheine-phosphate adenylyltransferase n=1 Tax=Spiroplasma endosymbiont of Labia minor TaxID=3066305 RepID=UPI0030D50001
MIAIYPGSFDPFHDGHMKIISKALKLFSKIYVVVTNNINKVHRTQIDLRFQKVKKILAHMSVVEVIINSDDLTSNVAKKYNANFMIRGIRNGEDLQYEIELSDANKMMNKDLETILFISDVDVRNISSTFISEIELYKNKK